MQAVATPYPWAEELEKKVIHSLTTSFGLDFLLFQDKHGGDVNTIHNARQGVYATDMAREDYERRGAYSETEYHKDKRYIKKGAADAARQDAGKLKDGYTGRIMQARTGVRDLDHIQSAKEIHDDPGRVLAGVSGVELANDESNLVSTHRSVNRSKQASSIDEFLARLPDRIKDEQRALTRDRKKLEAMPRTTPQERHAAQILDDKIRKSEERLDEWQAVDHDAMRKKDRAARKQYNGRVSREYYASSKFWGDTLSASGNAGLRMGTRQMLGLVMAEAWFELRDALPRIATSMRQDFSLDAFVKETRATFSGIWKRVKDRFKTFLTAFKDGVFSGILGSVTTTVLNIFATTAKNSIKIIREMWSQLVAAFKLWIFNPEKLSSTDLAKAVMAVLSAGVATVVGGLVYAQLAPVLAFPFGQELAAFAGALVTGVVTMGLHYFLSHSRMMQRIWDFLDRSSHAKTLRQIQTVNAQLDEYLEEIARIELKIDTVALETFSKDLDSAKDESERGAVIQREVKKRNVKLPFDADEPGSARRWLVSLAK